MDTLYQREERTTLNGVIRSAWFLGLAALVFAVPSLVRLAQTVWSTEQGAHGPIILATGLWLLVHEAAGVRPERGRPAVTAIAIGLGIAGYLFGRVAGMLWFEWLCAYIVLVGIGHAYIGGRGLKTLWFPLFYLLFLVPPPFSVITPITSSLRLMISSSAVEILRLAGYQVASSGVTLFIDGYELLVAAACSGMNSLVSLLAIGLFYIYLRHRAEWRYALLLAVLVVPIAILANLIRVIILMLLTHYGGMELGQGMLHEAAGMMMFFIALISLMLLDGLLTPVARWLRRNGEPG